MKFGLLGKSLQHSFSKAYFQNKFIRLNLPYTYVNFELSGIEAFPGIIEKNPDLRGLNVTVPYKESIIPFLDRISDQAREIGAVNTIVFKHNVREGFNTDVYGFGKSLRPLLKKHHQKALILGTGGASKAVAYVLRNLNIQFSLVSRQPNNDQLSYSEAGQKLINHFLVINTTPLGTFPHITESPPLSLQLVGENHLFYDLVYNPGKTHWLEKAEAKGAAIKNGLEMLQLQAERSWEIWMSGEVLD